jgi:hypothetical protein
MTNNNSKTAKAIKAAGSAAAGAAVGYGTVAVGGWTAIGAVGGGAGIGTAAGPVGVVIGAVTGLAAYAVYRLFK